MWNRDSRVDNFNEDIYINRKESTRKNKKI